MTRLDALAASELRNREAAMQRDLDRLTGGDTWAALAPVIRRAIAAQPRSQQVRIGPSEIGTTCNACLVCKLAGAPKAAESAWLPWVGTCVHSGLEAVFADQPGYLVEQEVTVGQIGGEDITGHADLFNVGRGEVIDWKIVGKSTLDAVRRKGIAGAKPVYEVQRHLYGVGFAALGYEVRTVSVVLLPRNHPSMDACVVDSAPFDPAVAEAALARANNAHAYLAEHGLSAAVEFVGGHTLTEYDCARYEGAPA